MQEVYIKNLTTFGKIAFLIFRPSMSTTGASQALDFYKKSNKYFQRLTSYEMVQRSLCNQERIVNQNDQNHAEMIHLYLILSQGLFEIVIKETISDF